MRSTKGKFPQASFWERQTFLEEVDVAIIGGGIVGVNAALALRAAKPHLRILLLERGSIPSGASTRNAGFACIGSMSELLDDLAIHPPEKVWALVEKRWRGLSRLREIVGEENMDFSASGNDELFRPKDEVLYQECMEQLDLFNEKMQAITGQGNCFVPTDERIRHLGFGSIKHLIRNRVEGQLHPGKMMRCLLNLAQESGIRILNGVNIAELREEENGLSLLGQNGLALKAKRCLVATNGFVGRLLPDLDLKPARNQVLITQPILGLKIKGCFHYDKGYFYFRNVGNRILLGGARNLDVETETTDEFGTTKLIQEALDRFLKEVILPEQKVGIEQWWSGILGVGGKKSPIIKMLSPRIGVALRLGGMGVAIGTLVGEEAAKMIQEVE